MTYTEETNELTGYKFIRRESDGAMIPTDPANSDYQRYLRWLENPQAALSTPIVSGDAD